MELVKQEENVITGETPVRSQYIRPKPTPNNFNSQRHNYNQRAWNSQKQQGYHHAKHHHQNQNQNQHQHQNQNQNQNQNQHQRQMPQRGGFNRPSNGYHHGAAGTPVSTNNPRKPRYQNFSTASTKNDDEHSQSNGDSTDVVCQTPSPILSQNRSSQRSSLSPTRGNLNKNQDNQPVVQSQVEPIQSMQNQQQMINHQPFLEYQNAVHPQQNPATANFIASSPPTAGPLYHHVNPGPAHPTQFHPNLYPYPWPTYFTPPMHPMAPTLVNNGAPASGHLPQTQSQLPPGQLFYPQHIAPHHFMPHVMFLAPPPQHHPGWIQPTDHQMFGINPNQQMLMMIGNHQNYASNFSPIDTQNYQDQSQGKSVEATDNECRQANADQIQQPATSPLSIGSSLPLSMLTPPQSQHPISPPSDGALSSSMENFPIQ